MTTTDTPPAHRWPLDEPNTLLASNRTGMALDRTRLAVDRTLMAVVRTALSLISFGFTIYQFIGKFAPDHPRAEQSAKNFGLALIVLGILTLVFGLLTDWLSLVGLRRRRDNLHSLGLLAHPAAMWPSPTTIIALGLAVLGGVAIIGLWLRAGPLG